LIPDGEDDPDTNKIGTQSPSIPGLGAPGSQNPFAGLSAATDNGQAPLSQPSNWNFSNLFGNQTQSLIDRLYINPQNPRQFPNPDQFVPFFNRYYCSVFTLSGFNLQNDRKAALVSSYYLDILGRLAEPGGLYHWMQQLSNVEHEPTREAVARGINRSEESAKRIVRNLYATALQRQKSDAEGNGWVTLVQQGNLEEAMAGIYGSVEAFNRSYLGGRNPTKWVAYLYRKLLGRTGYAWEYRYWVNRRNQRILSNRVQTVREILQSFESEHKYVESMYIQYLGRAAEPAGLQHWLGLMQANQLNRMQVAEKFLASQEYYDKSWSAQGRWFDPDHQLIRFNQNFCSGL
jgi:hypothetical protein